MSGAAEKAQRIHVVLIHHGVEERVREAMKTVAVVADALSDLGRVHVSEVARQPRPFGVGTRELGLRLVRQWRLERRWAGYLGVDRRWVLSSGLLLVRLAMLAGASSRSSASHRSFIELALSAKHELAWRRALEDRADLLVVLEDDARHDVHSLHRIRALLAQVRAEGALENAYVDLAGGLSRRELRLERRELPRADGVFRLSRPASNTACGYLLGRRVVEGLAELTIREPSVNRLPADWILNRFFMDAATDTQRPEIVCLHSRPHALRHGSFTGDVVSSIRGQR